MTESGQQPSSLENGEKKSSCSLQCEDIFLLFVAIGDVAVAVGQVEQWLIVVGCTGVLGILVEANLPFVQDTVKVDP